MTFSEKLKIFTIFVMIPVVLVVVFTTHMIGLLMLPALSTVIASLSSK